MQEKFFLQICETYKGISLEKLLLNDCFFVEKKDLSYLISKLYLFDNLKPIQIFQIEMGEHKESSIETYAENIWNWLVECETGVK